MSGGVTAPGGSHTPTYYVRDGQLIRKGGNCDCKVACTEVVKLEDVNAAHAELVAALTSWVLAEEAVRSPDLEAHRSAQAKHAAGIEYQKARLLLAALAKVQP